MRVAAVEIGTNAAKLVIADIARHELDEVVTPVRRSTTVMQLGAEVAVTGVLPADAVGRAVAVLHGYGVAIAAAGCEAVAAVATGPIGLAADCEQFLDRVAGALGTRPVLVGNDHRATLMFQGARTGIASDAPVLLIDPGRESTELVMGKGDPTFAASMPIGTHWLSERRLSMVPVASGALAAARFDVTDALLDVDLPESPVTVVGAGSTLTALAAVALDAGDGRVHGTVLPIETVTSLVGLLGSMPADEIARLPGVPADRAGVLLAGAVIVEQLLAGVGLGEVIVSTGGLIDAMILQAADQVA